MIIRNIDKVETRVFFSSYHAVATNSIVEKELMEYVKKTYFHCLIYKNDILDVIRDLRNRQEEILKGNKRLKRIAIRNSALDADMIWIHIGIQFFTLCEVRKEIESITEEPDVYLELHRIISEEKK